MLDPKAEALTMLSELRADLDALVQLHNSFCQGAQTTGTFAGVDQLASGGSESAQLFEATKQMQEMQQSFNMQYLLIQQKMQSDNRQFTLLSNIMKTKHDTAKNAINNIR
jgi:hypothetical protein